MLTIVLFMYHVCRSDYKVVYQERLHACIRSANAECYGQSYYVLQQTLV